MAEKQEQLLIISTRPDQLAALTAIIAELDLMVTLVERVELGQEAVEDGEIDLVILDGRQLDESGRGDYCNFTAQLSASNIPVIILSANGEMEQVAHFIGCGADDYIQAPFDKTQVRLRIASNLERRHLVVDREEHLKNAELLKIEQDIQIARRIQAGFLPKDLPQPDGWQVAARFQPAREVAGDFYDAFTLSQGRRVGFVIADVVDKGVPAALFMALVRSLIRAFAQQHYALSWTDALEGTPTKKRRGKQTSRRLPSTGTIALHNAVLLTNNYILDNHIDLNMFATLFFGLLDPQTGDLAYINAGHNPPYIITQDGQIKAKLTSTGAAVGMFPGVDFQIDYGKLEPGDVLFAYTDGVTEARASNKEFVTEKRLENLISVPVSSATEIIDRIDNFLKDFTADAVQFDDITMIAVSRDKLSETE